MYGARVTQSRSSVGRLETDAVCVYIRVKVILVKLYWEVRDHPLSQVPASPEFPPPHSHQPRFFYFPAPPPVVFTLSSTPTQTPYSPCTW